MCPHDRPLHLAVFTTTGRFRAPTAASVSASAANETEKGDPTEVTLNGGRHPIGLYRCASH